MGIYVYGVTANKKDVEGLDAPVHLAKYVYKPSFGYNGYKPSWVNRVLSRYANAPYRGNLIVIDWKVGEFVIKIADSGLFNNNYHYDSDWEENVGFLIKKGRKWAIETDFSKLPEYVDEQNNVRVAA